MCCAWVREGVWVFMSVCVCEWLREGERENSSSHTYFVVTVKTNTESPSWDLVLDWCVQDEVKHPSHCTLPTECHLVFPTVRRQTLQLIHKCFANWVSEYYYWVIVSLTCTDLKWTLRPSTDHGGLAWRSYRPTLDSMWFSVWECHSEEASAVSETCQSSWCSTQSNIPDCQSNTARYGMVSREGASSQ